MKDNTQYIIQGKKLILFTGSQKKEVIFNFFIEKVIPVDNFFLVLLEYEVGIIFNENVFCLNSEGKILWQVEPLEIMKGEDSPYTGMSFINGKITLYSWDGTDVVVDINTGKVLSTGFNRF